MSFVNSYRVVATVCASVGIFSTLLRLLFRWQRRHVGFDDAWAAFALAVDFVLVGGAWLNTDPAASNHQKVIGYYVFDIAFTCVLWSARMSILASILRIVPSIMTLRRYTHACAFLMLCMWIAMLVQKTYVCEYDTAWKTAPHVQCFLGKPVAAVEFCTDITSDAMLIILALRLIWGVSIPYPTRRLLKVIFSASFITTIASVTHASYLLGPDRNAECITAHVEANISLLICNLSVLAPWAARAVSHEPAADTLTSAPSRRRRGVREIQNSTLHFNRRVPVVLTAIAGQDLVSRSEESDRMAIELSVVKYVHRMAVDPEAVASILKSMV
ncbi:hypothetical protein IEO21_02125 [Rhodonia placenta]|uniref:Rhodopsin domain-containing protein n=1 Tax=Rhodonia placenta TaxID=104341 RepID=A0A8H7P8C5_9APHY|nr:hypothetical protein IEO21_02125 [Postia placenta]